MITRPAVWMLSHSTNLAVRVMGGDPKRQRQEVSEEELKDLVGADPPGPSGRRRGPGHPGPQVMRQYLIATAATGFIDAATTTEPVPPG